jgi:hypothetical protein
MANPSVKLGVQQQPGHSDDPVQGGADFVAHVRQKLALGDAGRLGLGGQLVGEGGLLLQMLVQPLGLLGLVCWARTALSIR